MIASRHPRKYLASVSEQSGAVQASSQLYMDAIDILADQDDGKEGLSGDLFRQAIGVLGYPLPIFTPSALEACTEVLHFPAGELKSRLEHAWPAGISWKFCHRLSIPHSADEYCCLLQLGRSGWQSMQRQWAF